MVSIRNSPTFQIRRVTLDKVRRIGYKAAGVFAHLEVVIDLVIRLRVTGNHKI